MCSDGQSRLAFKVQYALASSRVKALMHGDGHNKRGYHSILGFTGHNLMERVCRGFFYIFISSSIPSHDDRNAIQHAHIIMKAAKPA